MYVGCSEVTSNMRAIYHDIINNTREFEHATRQEESEGVIKQSSKGCSKVLNR
jgi:hypothetical protein